MPRTQAPILIDQIEPLIFEVRGQKVLLDSDLARLYGVSTKRLNEQVRRNRDRFPGDFMFQLTAEEIDSLRSQNATSKSGRGGRRYRPFVFTEHGAIMAATVLSSPRAVEVSVFVVRAFVKLRVLAGAHKELARKLDEIERKYYEKFRIVFDAIRQLMAPPAVPEKRRRIGFGGD